MAGVVAVAEATAVASDDRVSELRHPVRPGEITLALPRVWAQALVLRRGTAVIFHDPVFIERMINRMTVSGHKYGPVEDVYPHTASALDQLRERLRFYEEDGNTEWLIDCANFCMIEAMAPSRETHYDPHAASPGLRTHDGTRITGDPF